MENTPKILIAVPCMDSVAAQFSQALAMLEKEGKCLVSFVIGSLIYNSRNDLVRQALKLECDYILWLDSDMVFPPETLKYLLKEMEETGADFISGLYFRRCAPFSPVAFDTLEIKDGKATWTDYRGELSGLHEVGGVGFGCVLQKTDMLLEMAAKYGDFFGPLANVGEDLAFCWRARQLGYKIMLDCNLKLGHVGHTVFTQQYFEALQGDA